MISKLEINFSNSTKTEQIKAKVTASKKKVIIINKIKTNKEDTFPKECRNARSSLKVKGY